MISRNPFARYWLGGSDYFVRTQSAELTRTALRQIR
jgi:hypothetical protein